MFSLQEQLGAPAQKPLKGKPAESASEFLRHCYAQVLHHEDAALDSYDNRGVFAVADSHAAQALVTGATLFSSEVWHC